MYNEEKQQLIAGDVNYNGQSSQAQQSSMNISKIHGFEHFGTFKLNEKPSKTLIYLSLCHSTDNRNGSHVYLIVVDGVIYKIGASTVALKKFGGYGVGNAGQPSDRTTGIHYYIAKYLYEGKKVDFYIQMAPPISPIQIRNTFTGELENLVVDVDPKVIENYHIKKYKDEFGVVPVWNKQEGGRKSDWEADIKIINRSLKEKRVIPYQEGVEYSIIMKLYHWKHNLIPI